MTTKHVNINKVIHAANVRKLFVLYTPGTGKAHKYEFYSRATGKWVLTFYPELKLWTTLDGKGDAVDHHEALARGLDRTP